jgi:hypothetical protein
MSGACKQPQRAHCLSASLALAKISIEKGQQLTGFYWKPKERECMVINKYKFFAQKISLSTRGKSFYMFH